MKTILGTLFGLVTGFTSGIFLMTAFMCCCMADEDAGEDYIKACIETGKKILN